MGFGGKVRFLATVGVGLATTSMGACLDTTDPVVPCPASDYAIDESGGLVASPTAPVLALSGKGDGVRSILLHVACEGDDCRLRRDELAWPAYDPSAPSDAPPSIPLPPSSQVVISGSGRYVMAVEPRTDVQNSDVHIWRVEDGQVVAEKTVLPPDPLPWRLIAGLRGSDSILYRDRDRNLYAFDPGSLASAVHVADPRMYVVAIGERHLVVREITGEGTDTLHVIDALDDRGKTEALVEASGFSRVSIAPGDTWVIATTRAGDDSETFVFDTATASLVDRFMGAAVTSRVAGETIPGLSAMSPDGTRLAYRTPSGALALRDPTIQGSCLVRSASAGDHRVAGFSADGRLFIESIEGGTDTSRVMAFDPRTRELVALGEPRHGLHLASVPARTSVGTPWAIAVSDGSYYAVTSSTAMPPQALSYAETEFLPRDDDGVWAIVTHREGARRVFALRRVVPNTFADGLDFDEAASDPHWYDDDGNVDMGPFKATFYDSNVCLATGTPGDWAYRCGQPNEDRFFLGSGIPNTEEPGGEDPGAN